MPAPWATWLLVKDLASYLAKGRNDTFKDVNVRRQKISDALLWLIQNNPHYSDVQIDYEALNALPDNAVHALRPFNS